MELNLGNFKESAESCLKTPGSIFEEISEGVSGRNLVGFYVRTPGVISERINGATMETSHLLQAALQL